MKRNIVGNQLEEPNNRNNEIEIAYHEAGHAIAYLKQGLPVFEITIFQKDEENPFCRSLNDEKYIDSVIQLEGIDAGKDFIKKNIVALYAGSEPYSNLDISVVKNENGLDWNIDTDSQLIGLYIDLYVSRFGDDIDDLEEFCFQLKKEAKRIIDVEWDRVQRLAEVLIKKRSLMKIDIFPEYKESYRLEYLIKDLES